MRRSLITIAFSLIFGLVLVSACGGGSSEDAPAPTPSRGSPVSLPTSDWQPGDDSMAALLSGTLRADETGCPFIDVGSGKVTLVWPQGYTAARVGNGDIVVSDPSGEVAARTGDHMSLGGGQVPVDGKQPCLDGAEKAFVINQDLTSD
jgi:hypothetical protein